MSRTLTYSMQLSLDGYVAGPNGELDWHRIDEEIHRHFNEQERATQALLYGRCLYELMAAYWPFAADDESLPDYMRDYSLIWRDKPKYVFSRTLHGVDWNSQLMDGDAVEAVRQLKAAGDGVLSIGGPTLARAVVDAGLVDEYRLYLTPVILGGGRPMFDVHARRRTALIETHRFGSGVVLLRYRDDGPGSSGAGT